MKDENTKISNLDAAVDLIRADRPSETDITNAAERVHAMIMGQNDLPASGAVQWNSIDDYIAAIPNYLAKRLTPAQNTLFEEESRQSIPLRRALNAAREKPVAANENSRLPKTPLLRWLASAAAVAAIAISFILIMPDLPAFNQTRIFQVAEVNGTLYQITNGRLETLVPGTWIDGRQSVRTGKNTTAILLLDDGSRVEVGGRSELNVIRRWSGNRINVDRGRIIVAASAQGSGTLDVATHELTVSVTGTIFEVGHGAMGSHVAVIEGEVQVYQRGEHTSLLPGEQMNSRTGRSIIRFDDEIAWSGNADKYLKMLKEVSALQKDINAVMETTPRYSTRLLNLAPEKTVLYIAVPNAPEKIAEIYDLMRSRLQQSPGLAEVWSNVEVEDQDHHIDKVMTWLRNVGEHLGDETVATVSLQVTPDGKYQAVPVILSEVDATAFASTFETQIQQLHEASAGDQDKFKISLINNPSDAVEGQLSIWLHEDLLVASISPAAIIEVQTILEEGTSAFIDSGFFELLQGSYDQGAEFLGAVDLARIMSLRNFSHAELDVFGLSNARYLTAERRQQGELTSVVIELLFDGETKGMMSWLEAPGPMGSLEFFSADATIAAALVVKDPATIVVEMQQMIGKLKHRNHADAGPDDELDVRLKIDLELAVQIIENLGGEVAFGLDGPVLPTPAWKVVIEVYDELAMQQSIERAIRQLNESTNDRAAQFSAEVTAADIEPYIGYQISLLAKPDPVPNNPAQAVLPTVTFNYAYVDGYLVAAPNRALVDQAISHYQAGTGLLTDAEFRSLLPQDGYLDFSAVAFNRIGELLADMLEHVPNALSTEQLQAVTALSKESGPSMYSVYGNPGSIRFVQNGSSHLPFGLSQFLSLQTMLKAAQGQNQSDELPDGTNGNR